MTQLAADDFDRANENPLGNGVWSAPSGVNPCKIVSNAATASVNDGNDNVSYYSGVSWPNDQYSEITIGAFCCPVVRVASGAATYYLAADDGAGNILIYKRVAGTYTQIGTGAGSFGAGQVARLEANGTTIRCLVNGVQKATCTDSAIASGSAGVLTETTNTVTAWAGGDFSSGGTVALTGQAATASAGTLAPSSSKALTGQAATASAGTLAPSSSKGLTGQAASSAPGTLAPSLSVPLTGLQATMGQGTLTPLGDAGATLTGQAASSAAGTLAPSSSVPLAGAQATMAQGTLTPNVSNDVTVALMGIEATAIAGNLTAEGGTAPVKGGLRVFPLDRRRLKIQRAAEVLEQIDALPVEKPPAVKRLKERVSEVSSSSSLTDAELERRSSDILDALLEVLEKMLTKLRRR